MTMQTVWLSGAKGFTGQHLLPILRQAGYQCDTKELDITDRKAVENHIAATKPDFIINLAAISFVPDGADAHIYAVNSFGPENILESCVATHRPQKIILASSANVYGRSTQDRIDELTPLAPVNHYGYSKWVMEQIAARYQDNLEITVTRPFNYTGLHQDEKFLIPKIVSHFKHKAPRIALGNIDIWRDFSDVRWIAEAYLQLLTADKNPQIVNLCSQRLISIREIIGMLTELTGHEIEVYQDPNFMRKDDIERQCGDNQKLFASLPALKKPYDLQATLKWMLDLENTPPSSP